MKLNKEDMKRYPTYLEKKIKQGNNEAQLLYMIPKPNDYGNDVVNQIRLTAVEVINYYQNIQIMHLVHSIRKWNYNRPDCKCTDLMKYSVKTVRMIVEKELRFIEERSNSKLKRVTKEEETVIFDGRIRSRQKCFVNNEVIKEAKKLRLGQKKRKSKSRRK